MMAIGGVVKEVTKMLAKRAIRKGKTEVLRQKMLSASSKEVHKPNKEPVSSDTEVDEINELLSSNADTSDIVYRRKPARNFLILPNVSEICDRFNISDRGGSAIAIATLQDVRIISKGSTSLVIDRSKLRRQKMQRRRRASLQHKQQAEQFGLYFDGRKDSAIAMRKIGSK